MVNARGRVLLVPRPNSVARMVFTCVVAATRVFRVIQGFLSGKALETNDQVPGDSIGSQLGCDGVRDDFASAPDQGRTLSGLAGQFPYQSNGCGLRFTTTFLVWV